MEQHCLDRRKVFGGVQLLSCLVGLAFFASRSSASCGDWLAESPQGMDHADSATVESPVQGLAEFHDVTGPRGRARSRPCRGPHCHKAPDLPHAPLPSTPVRMVDDTQGLLTHCRLNPTVGRVLARFDDSAAIVTTAFSSRVERPPRG